MRRVLMIAFYIAPATDVGARRTDRFVRYLPQFGWEPIVLSVKTKYYTRCDPTEILPNSFYMTRTVCPMPLIWYYNRKRRPSSAQESKQRECGNPSFSPPASVRDFSFRSRVAWSLQIPDEFNCWIPFGVWEGWRLIRRFRPSVIYASAKPISAHVIGWVLKRLTGVPLVLDFRDIWVGNPWEIEQPAHVRRWKESIERRLVRDADYVILNTPKALEIYLGRYQDVPDARFGCIPNGYDPAEFTHQDSVRRLAETADPVFTIVHTGTVYGFMDPRPLLQAIRDLLNSRLISENEFRLDFYGAYLVRFEGRDLRDIVCGLGLEKVVRLNAPVSRAEALYAQQRADALLILVPGTDVAVPSKTYEYLPRRKPILALCSPQSATAQLIRETRTGVVVDPFDTEAIKSALLKLVSGQLSFEPNEEAIVQYSAPCQTQHLSSLFETVGSGLPAIRLCD